MTASPYSYRGARLPPLEGALGDSVRNCWDQPGRIRWLTENEWESLPPIARRVAHLIFAVPDLVASTDRLTIISEQRVHIDGTRSVFIEKHGVPIQLIEFNEPAAHPDLQVPPSDYHYHSFWVPRLIPHTDDVHLKDFKMYVNQEANEFGVGWVRYQDDAPYDAIIKTVPHLAFEVPDLEQTVADKRLLIPPKTAQPGLRIAFVDIGGIPIEYLEIDRAILPDGV